MFFLFLLTVLSELRNCWTAATSRAEILESKSREKNTSTCKISDIMAKNIKKFQRDYSIWLDLHTPLGTSGSTEVVNSLEKFRWLELRCTSGALPPFPSKCTFQQRQNTSLFFIYPCSILSVFQLSEAGYPLSCNWAFLLGVIYTVQCSKPYIVYSLLLSYYI
jgi:hypothetical protein